MKILIVGGGTAGLIASLILKKRFNNFQIDLVYSKDIGIIGVGEGSTEHFANFIKYTGININELIKETDATYKSSIYFENWADKNYFHLVQSDLAEKIGQYPYIYAKLICENQNLYFSSVEKNKIHSYYLNNLNEQPFYQLHFNTHKLNDYFKKNCKKNNINLYEDNIINIYFKENGEINYLVGEKQEYHYDFYIDATGFKRLLIGKMGSKWISFKDYLKMKSAIVFPTPDEEEYNLWTLAKAMNYGWRFKIPTWGRHGNGYIFDSDYITADQAKKELDKEFGYNVEISKEFKFDPGYLDKVWIKNCVAIGLSGSFVEPLEATSIGTSINQSFLLMHKIINYSEIEIKQYNSIFSNIMLNIRDFIFIHYLSKNKGSEFWESICLDEGPNDLIEKMKMWKNKMPIKEDFIGDSSYCLFNQDNYAVVLYGMGWFNKFSIFEELKSIPNELSFLANNKILKSKQFFNIGNKISHKKYLSVIRDFL